MSERDQGYLGDLTTLEGIRATVRERYGAVAQRVAGGATAAPSISVFSW